METTTRVMIELRSPEENILLQPNLSYSHFRIEELSIPHVWNYLPAGNTIFTDSLGVIFNFPYSNQQPAITDFAQLVIAMNTFDTGGAVYSYAVDLVTMTITFTSTATFGLSFDKWIAQHIGVTQSLGGDRYGFVGLTTYTTGHFFFGTQRLLLSTGLQVMGQSTAVSNYTTPMSAKAELTIQNINNIVLPVRSAIGSIETWYLGEYGLGFRTGQNPMQLNIKITDEYGLLIDVSPQRMYLTLVYYC